MAYPSVSSIGRIINDDKDKMRVFPVKINHFGKRIKINRKKVITKPTGFKAEYPGHCVALDTIEKRLNGSKRYILTFIDSILDLPLLMLQTSTPQLKQGVF
jgi:hypothetical protein